MGKDLWDLKGLSTALRAVVSLSLCLFLLIFTGCSSGPSVASPPAPPPVVGQLPPELRRDQPPSDGKGVAGREREFWVRVLRVIDGATLSLETLHVVRLVGVLPPQGPGLEAYAGFFEQVTTPAVRTIVEGKRVRLLRDKVERERGGRPLVYVYTEDGSLLNAILIQKGYARMSLEIPFKLQDEFRLWEQEAKDVGLGLWGLKEGRP